jgi:hypothetical protein
MFKTNLQTQMSSRMKKGNSRETLRSFCLLPLAFCLFVIVAAAQDNTSKPQPGPQSAKEYLGPTADSIQPYRPYNRDPFKKAIKPKTPKAKNAEIAKLLGFPAIDVRRAEFRQKVDQSRMRDLAEPDPVTQYLVNELDVTGVFRDERGYGAFVKAQPTGTVLFIRNGARCYNGEIVRIETDEAESGGAKVMFREFSYTEQNGKRTQQERMVIKAPTATPSKQ